MRHRCEFLFCSWKSSQQPRAALVQQRHVLVGEMTRNILEQEVLEIAERIQNLVAEMIKVTTQDRHLIVQEIPEVADKDS